MFLLLSAMFAVVTIPAASAVSMLPNDQWYIDHAIEGVKTAHPEIPDDIMWTLTMVSSHLEYQNGWHKHVTLIGEFGYNASGRVEWINGRVYTFNEHCHSSGDIYELNYVFIAPIEKPVHHFHSGGILITFGGNAPMYWLNNQWTLPDRTFFDLGRVDYDRIVGITVVTSTGPFYREKTLPAMKSQVAVDVPPMWDVLAIYYTIK